MVLLGVLLIQQQQHDKKYMAGINTLEEKLAPIVTALEGVGVQLNKAKDEIIKALGGIGTIPAGALAKIEQLGTIAVALKAASQGLDELNDDEPVAPPAEPPAQG